MISTDREARVSGRARPSPEGLEEPTHRRILDGLVIGIDHRDHARHRRRLARCSDRAADAGPLPAADLSVISASAIRQRALSVP